MTFNFTKKQNEKKNRNNLCQMSIVNDTLHFYTRFSWDQKYTWINRGGGETGDP